MEAAFKDGLAGMVVSPPWRIKLAPALAVVVPVTVSDLPAVLNEPLVPPPITKLPATARSLVDRITLAPLAMVTLLKLFPLDFKVWVLEPSKVTVAELWVNVPELDQFPATVNVFVEPGAVRVPPFRIIILPLTSRL